ncbi:tubulin polyglutamylase complex subunit 2 isoform X1 [Diorhabda carinulata]|uniref:tubulin polyglutamylase complex subunit 2 isoform X1 n=2 Tax=Diorhabda carinulata TaxID=1163345 RepID=UPI0025A1DF00|nr:tubulin polyglutamylase complex subunit 2 isoform X1 [Diorhabda carinulata]
MAELRNNEINSFRKMGFVVDKVSEDSFYENLLLGLSKVLEKSPFVSNLALKRYPGVRQMDIRTWEHNNSIALPEDLKCFFSSSNGFSYTYDFSYEAENQEKSTRQGKLEVNQLNDVARIYGYETKNTAQIEKVANKYKLILSRDSKVFELCTVDENAKVVLVYINTYSNPTIWLYTTPMIFNHIADDFTIYFRRCIAHLGIPCWQYIVSNKGLPEWTKEIFLLLAPGVLQEDKNLVETPRVVIEETNIIDPAVFLSSTNSNHGLIMQAMQQAKSTKEKKSKTVPKKQVNSKLVRKHEK